MVMLLVCLVFLTIPSSLLFQERRFSLTSLAVAALDPIHVISSFFHDVRYNYALADCSFCCFRFVFLRHCNDEMFSLCSFVLGAYTICHALASMFWLLRRLICLSGVRHTDSCWDNLLISTRSYTDWVGWIMDMECKLERFFIGLFEVRRLYQ